MKATTVKFYINEAFAGLLCVIAILKLIDAVLSR